MTDHDKEMARGEYVARRVWDWLRGQKSTMYVPWVVDDRTGDPIKIARQEERDEFLRSLEDCMKKAANDAKEAIR